MARLLRSYGVSRYRGPVVVLQAPPPPVVTTLTVYPATGLLTNQRRAQQRRAYSRLAPPATLLLVPTQQQQTAAVKTTRARPPATGVLVAPPVVVLPLPTQQMQTVGVALAVRYRRLTDQPRFPLPGWTGGLIDSVTAAGLLDSFNRADGNLVAPWATMPNFGGNGMAIASNVAVHTFSTSASYFKTAAFGPNVEVQGVSNGGGAVVSLFARITLRTNGFIDGYEVQVSANLITIRRWVNGVPTPIFTYNSAIFAWGVAGQTLRFILSGSSLRVIVLDAGGAVIAACSVIDGINSGEGYVGIGSTSPTDGWDSVSVAAPGAAPQGSLIRLLGPRPPALLSYTAPPILAARNATPVAVLSRRRHAQSRLPLVIATTATAFVASPVDVTRASVDRSSRRQSAYRLGSPVVVAAPAAVETTVAVSVARARPRRVQSDLPLVVPAASAFVAPPISVNCVSPDRLSHRFRRQAPGTALGAPTALQVFTGSRTPLVRTRPRPTLALTSRLALVQAPPVVEQTVAVTTVRARPRPKRAALSPPVIVAAAAQTFAAARLSPARTRPRGTRSFLAVPVALQAFGGPQINELPLDRFNRRHRRPPQSQLFPPATLEPEAIFLAERTDLVRLVRTRPRHTLALLGEPTVVRVPSIEQKQQSVQVSLVRVRPRRTMAVLAEPTTLQVFAGPLAPRVRIRPRHTIGVVAPPATLTPYAVELAEETVRVALVRIRPRHTITALRPPTVVRVPSVEQQEQTLRVSVVRARPRSTIRYLAPPTVLQVFAGADVTVVRVRPRPVVVRVAPPAALQTFRGAAAPLVRTRPRHVISIVRPPATLEPFAVELREETIRVSLVRIRPRPTGKTLGEPTALQTFAGPSVVKTRIRPVSTTTLLSPPTVIRIPSVEQGEETIRTVLVRTRPRHTASVLPLVLAPTFAPVETTLQATLTRVRPRPTVVSIGAPVVLQVFAAPLAPLTRSRPKPTRHFLSPPTVVRVPSVEQAEETLRIATVRARPRPTVKRLSPPTALQIFSGPRVTLTRIRPRATERALGEPTVIRTPSVEQREQTISVALAKIRPRPTTRVLAEPTVLQVFAAAAAHLVQIRPRPTRHSVAPPTVVRVPAVEQQEDTIRVALVAVRAAQRRRTTFALTEISYPQTGVISVTLVQTRPRPTVTVLTAVSYAATSELSVTVSRTRPRPTISALGAPAVLQVFASGEPVLTRIRPRATRWLVRPPTAVRVPSVEQREDTIVVSLARIRPRPTRHFLIPPLVKTFPPVVTTVAVTTVAVRTRVEQRRHVVEHVLGEPTVVIPLPTLRAQTVAVALTRVRPRHTRAFLTSVSYAATSRIRVATVRTRPRATIVVLAPPTALQVFTGPAVTVVFARPRPTLAALREPVVLRTFAGPVEAEIAVRTAAAPARHLPHSRLAPPAALRPTVTQTRTALARVRPRATTSFLAAPVVVAQARVNDQIQTALAQTRPRPVASTLLAPTAVRRDTFAGPLVSVAPAHRGVARSILLPPTVVARAEFFGPSTTLAPSRRVRARSFLFPPTVVVVTPPTPEQQTIQTTLVDVPARQRLRIGRWLLPPVLPPFPPATIPGFPASSGYAAAGAASDGSATAGAGSDGGAVSGAGSEGRAVPVTESDGWAAPGTASKEG